MCDFGAISGPALASLAISAVGAIAQMQQSQAQNAAIDNQTIATNNALSLQQQQDNHRAAQEQAHRATQGAVERGAQSAASSESNFFGNSTNSLFQESLFNEGSDITTIEKNRVNRSKQVQSEKEGNTLRGNNSKTSSAAIYGRAGLQIAGAGLDAYKASQNPKKT